MRKRFSVGRSNGKQRPRSLRQSFGVLSELTFHSCAVFTLCLFLSQGKEGRSLAEKEPAKSPQYYEVTACLERWRQGDALAIHQVYEMLYAELKQNAASVLARFNPGQANAMTFSPTDLLHEVSARILDCAPSRAWQHRKEFYALMSKAMLNLLIGNHHKKATAKRGGDFQKVVLDEGVAHDSSDGSPLGHPDILALDQGLAALAQVDPVRSQILQLHFFEGHTIEEIAHMLDMAKSTVSTKKTIALGWLRTYLSKTHSAG